VNGATAASCALSNSTTCSLSSMGISIAATDLIGFQVVGTTTAGGRIKVATACQ
jgi:hypothetical protein